MTSRIIARYLNEFDWFNGEKIGAGHFLEVSAERRKAFVENPYLRDALSIFEWVGFADGRAAGFNYSFPIRVNADGVIYEGTTGSSLNVAEWARKTDLGLILPAKGVEETSVDGIAIAAACSQMAIPMHQINGYKYFFFSRLIALWRSRCVVERLVPRVLAYPVSSVIDLLIRFYRLVLRCCLTFVLRRYELRRVCAKNDEDLQIMAAIVREDTHRFREEHDSAWFRWHMTCSFSSDGPCEGWLLRRMADRHPVAFALVKRRFHKQASHRGYRNVWLGSFVDWGTMPGYENLTGTLVAALALKMARTCDAVDCSTDDAGLVRFLRRIGWRHVGDTNVGIKLMRRFPLYGDQEILDKRNWRIRPGMGDNGLS